jgi:hypothetical protein
LLEHVVGSLAHGINSYEWALLVDLHLFDVLNVFNGVETGVLGQGHWDLLKSVSESSHGVLFNSFDFISGLVNLDGTGELGGTTSSDNIIVFDHVSNDTDGIEEASLGFITDSLGSTSDHAGNGLRFNTVFN